MFGTCLGSKSIETFRIRDTCFIVRLPPLNNHYENSRLKKPNRHWSIQNVLKQWCDTKNSSVSCEFHQAMNHLIFAHLCFFIAFKCSTSMIESQKSSAGLSPMRKPVSNKKIQESDELCEAAVVSCSSSFLEQMHYFQICTMFHQKSISSLQDLLQNQSLETVPISIIYTVFWHE